jgi:hypothetical protein
MKHLGCYWLRTTWRSGSRSFTFSGRVFALGRLDGVYTAATKGNLVFGGWTKQGRSRFNYYCKLVQEDRSSDQSAHVEKEFLIAMQKTPRGKENSGSFAQMCSKSIAKRR